MKVEPALSVSCCGSLSSDPTSLSGYGWRVPASVCVCVCVCACTHARVHAQSCLTLCASVDCNCQAPLSMGFLRQEYWSGLPCPSPGNLPDPGIKPRSPALQADSLLSEPSLLKITHFQNMCVFHFHITI